MEGALGNKRLHAQDLGRFQIRRLLARPAELRPCDGYCRVSEYLQVLWLLGPARVCLIPHLSIDVAVDCEWPLVRTACIVSILSAQRVFGWGPSSAWARKGWAHQGCWSSHVGCDAHAHGVGGSHKAIHWNFEPSL